MAALPPPPSYDAHMHGIQQPRQLPPQGEAVPIQNANVPLGMLQENPIDVLIKTVNPVQIKDTFKNINKTYSEHNTIFWKSLLAGIAAFIGGSIALGIALTPASIAVALALFLIGTIAVGNYSLPHRVKRDTASFDYSSNVKSLEDVREKIRDLATITIPRLLHDREKLKEARKAVKESIEDLSAIPHKGRVVQQNLESLQKRLGEIESKQEKNKEGLSILGLTDENRYEEQFRDLGMLNERLNALGNMEEEIQHQGLADFALLCLASCYCCCAVRA